MASTVDFPGAHEEPLGVAGASGPGRRAPHLPFRRISMPSVPSAATMAQLRTANVNAKKDHRVSVASQQSTDSLPENQRVSDYSPSNNAGIPSPKPRRTMSRPSSLQPPPKTSTVTASTLAKRKKVLRELLDTEKTYLDGLEFINEHFLTPLVNTTTEGRPLLSPGQMASIFSNFLDMLGFHESFYSTLNDHLGPYVKSTPPPSAFPTSSSPIRTTLFTNPDTPPPVASLLMQHIPFLSMYTPFVTAYPTIMASLHNLTSPNSKSYSTQFAAWLKEREADPRSGNFGLRDWLLTLVQRCPRYLLLMRELFGYMEVNEPEYKELEEVTRMLERVNASLNAALETQNITLQLLAVQKATPNLPTPFLEPGRAFIKRGPLFQTADRVERIREFFLFSDCLVWLSKGGEREGATTNEEAQFKQSMITSPSSASFSAVGRRLSELDPQAGKRPLSRTPSSAPGSKIPGSTQLEDEKWWFRGKIDLLDLDISLPVATFGGEGKIDVHSPEMSFSLFCDSAEEREEWASAIRGAKQSRLVAMNNTNPNSTLTSSTSNQHLRLALQALPYAPDEGSSSASPQKKKGFKKDKEKFKDRQRRGHVEHFVPAIWVPDSKADSCIRCGGVFGWRRRRHHCRLCGNCVCANCSGKTFFITSKDTSKDQTKPARACSSCYEAVFPVLDPESPDDTLPSGGGLLHYSSIGTLTALPFSRSTPSLALPQTTAPVLHPPSLHYELPTTVKRTSRAESERPKSGLDFLPLARPRMPGSRPPSEIRSSSYTVSTMASSGAFEPMNDSIATMSMLDSPLSPISPVTADGSPRPRPKTTFSVPAVALHTTPVTARASMDTDGKAIRYSLVLGGKSRLVGGAGENREKVAVGRKSLDSSVAVGKLTDLLRK